MTAEGSRTSCRPAARAAFGLLLAAMAVAGTARAKESSAPPSPPLPAHVQAFNTLVDTINSRFEQGVSAFNSRRYADSCAVLTQASSSADELMAMAAEEPHGQKARQVAKAAQQEARRLRDRACAEQEAGTGLDP
ncbi:hypothetical protein EVJ50_01335 [Synechococcus sp. RSCCF101]|uniref:hypothetical protein n=1 Tax=Synechococcus sp. RSCCF101 TaxID=2511069 RepID=UPI001243F693|nr:hypothetical protein [Synechococcus sp. RSCCF101]QEY31097.1 hypothetical protein EVJ50_01335 [Synechococcus sp. RSCCF101]